MPADFVLKMHPHPGSRTYFKYPLGRLLELQGVVKEDELCQLMMLNETGNWDWVLCPRIWPPPQWIRHLLDFHGISCILIQQSRWAFLCRWRFPVITDPNGWIVSIITGGMGVIDSTDITYATPYYWVEQHIKMDFPNTFYPITAINSWSSTWCSLKGKFVRRKLPHQHLVVVYQCCVYRFLANWNCIFVLVSLSKVCRVGILWQM